MKNPFKRLCVGCAILPSQEALFKKITYIEDYLEKETAPHEHDLRMSKIQIFSDSVAFECYTCDYKTAKRIKDVAQELEEEKRDPFKGCAEEPWISIDKKWPQCKDEIYFTIHNFLRPGPESGRVESITWMTYGVNDTTKLESIRMRMGDNLIDVHNMKAWRKK